MPFAARSFALAVSVGAALLLAQTGSARVVLIGIDGGSWNLIDPAIDRGELPNLAAIAARGVTAELETVEPLISPTVWTSIATGQTPSVHGVTSFRSTRLTQQVPTIFERLAATGHRVGLYDYLVTWPPLQLPDGFVIPGWIRRDDRTWPEDVFERAGVSRYAYRTRHIRGSDRIYENCLLDIAEKPRRFLRFLETYDPEVAAVTFYSLDAASHRFWNAAYPESFPGSKIAPDPRRKNAIHEMLTGIDAALGEIVAALGPDDVVLVVSDHGFQADAEGVKRKWTLDFQHLLAEAGLDPERDPFTITSNWRKLVVEIEDGDYEDREALLQRWIALANSVRNEAGEALVEVEVARNRFASDFVGGWTQWAGDRIWGPSSKWYLPGNHAVVVITPVRERIEPLWPDGRIDAGAQSRSIEEIFYPVDFSGAHAPLGIFLAAGGPIAGSAERETLSVLEIAPLIAWLAGAAVPDDLRAVPVRLLRPAALAARPVVRVGAETIPRLADGPAPEVGEGDLEERLRSLGYLD